MLKRYCQQVFSIDLRTLALFRIALALVVLANLATRAFDMEAMYADGVMPLDSVKRHLPLASVLRLHLVNASVEFQQIMFVVTGLAAVALGVGWKTRRANAVLWVLIVSLHLRAPLLVNGGDALLSSLLFWSLFLPLGQVWSWDARRGAGVALTTDKHGPVCSVATAVILLQIGLMYWGTGLAKLGSEWISGRAIENVLNVDIYTTAFGDWLAGFPGWLKWLTWGTLLLELTAPYLLFVPWNHKTIRGLTVGLLVCLHLGIELTMHIQMFSWISLTALILFVPWPWRALPAEAASSESRTPHGANFWNQALAPAATVTCLALFVVVLMTNVGMVLFASHYAERLPAPMLAMSHALGLGQRWNMFTAPDGRDYRYVAHALLRDGTEVDILRAGQPVQTRDLQRLSGDLPSQRWRLFLIELRQPANQRFRHSTLVYWCKQWNLARIQSPDKQIAICDLLFVQQPPLDQPVPAASQPGGPEPNHRQQRRGEAIVSVLAKLDMMADGRYLDGLPHGPWLLRDYSTGTKRAQGVYRQGREVGRWIYWYPDGSREMQGTFRRGEMHGEWTFWYENGSVRRFVYDQGKQVRELPAPAPGDLPAERPPSPSQRPS